VAAQLVTAPLVAAISGRLSLVGVFANLAVAVVIPPITVLGTAAAAVCWCCAPAAGLLIRFTGPELWWLLRVASTAADVPGAAVSVPSGLAGVVSVAGATLAAVVLWRWVKVGVSRCRPVVKRSGGERDGGAASDSG
jgi:competence protein ComEC